MGTVSHLRNELRFDRWHRVIIEIGQRWVEKKDPSATWVIDQIESMQLDDKGIRVVHLRALDGVECESAYTEKYFRRWFYEIHQPRRKENMARSAKLAAPSLKRLLAIGVVVK